MGMIVSMNKKIFVLWGFIVVGILLSVLLIGINEKDLNYMKFEYTLKLAGKAYIKDNNSLIGFLTYVKCPKKPETNTFAVRIYMCAVDYTRIPYYTTY